MFLRQGLLQRLKGRTVAVDWAVAKADFQTKAEPAEAPAEAGPPPDQAPADQAADAVPTALQDAAAADGAADPPAAKPKKGKKRPAPADAEAGAPAQKLTKTQVRAAAAEEGAPRSAPPSSLPAEAEELAGQAASPDPEGDRDEGTMQAAVIQQLLQVCLGPSLVLVGCRCQQSFIWHHRTCLSRVLLCVSPCKQCSLGCCPAVTQHLREYMRLQAGALNKAPEAVKPQAGGAPAQATAAAEPQAKPRVQKAAAGAQPAGPEAGPEGGLNTTVFLRGLPLETTQDALRAALRVHGPVKSCRHVPAWSQMLTMGPAPLEAVLQEWGACAHLAHGALMHWLICTDGFIGGCVSWLTGSMRCMQGPAGRG